MEADLRRPGAARLLGLSSTVGLTSVLTYGVPLDQAIQPWSAGSTCRQRPAAAQPAELLGSMHMAALLADVGSSYDTVLIDTPPLLPVTDAAAIAPAADGVLLVTRSARRPRPGGGGRRGESAVSVPLLGTT